MEQAGRKGAERDETASTRETLETARRLRREQSPPERILWEHLRGKRLDGAKFRRQHPVGRYVFAFYCPAAHVAVEVDGESHDESVEADSVRDAWLAQQGIHVVRVRAAAVLADVTRALQPVRRALGARMPSDTP